MTLVSTFIEGRGPVHSRARGRATRTGVTTGPAQGRVRFAGGSPPGSAERSWKAQAEGSEELWRKEGTFTL